MQFAPGNSPSADDRRKFQQYMDDRGKKMMTGYGYKNFGQAQPKTADKQQGPLAEPPKQSTAPAQNQYGSSQASGDYSAYSRGGGYSPQQNPQYATQSRPQYGGSRRTSAAPEIATPEYWQGRMNPQYNPQHPAGGDAWLGGSPYWQGRMNPQYGGSTSGWPPGYSGPGSSPVEQMPRALPPPPPDSNGDGIPDVNGIPVGVQRPDFVQRQIDDLKRRGTWDDPRNAKARAELEQKLADINEAPPGYYKTPDGRFEPNYIGTFFGGFGGQQRSPVADMRAVYPMDPQRQADIGMRLGPSQSLAPVPGLPGMGEVQPAPTYAMPPQNYVFPLQGQGPQFYNQRDAFINNINTSLGQQMMQNFGGAQPVAPQLNIPQLWAQAGEMAANGWTNPLAALIGNV